MWAYNGTDELYHYGIPGMKWGHHKAQSLVSTKKQRMPIGARSLNGSSKKQRPKSAKSQNRNTTIKALEKLEDMAFFSNNKNSFAISSAIGDAKRKIENGESYANAALEALDTYNFYKD